MRDKHHLETVLGSSAGAVGISLHLKLITFAFLELETVAGKCNPRLIVNRSITCTLRKLQRCGADGKAFGAAAILRLPITTDTVGIVREVIAPRHRVGCECARR